MRKASRVPRIGLVGIAALAAWAFTACGGAGAGLESEEQGVQVLTRAEAAKRKEAMQQQSVTCTDTYGVCKVGRCELPVDDFQQFTETCCDSLGHCTVTQWKICGCVSP